MPTIELPAQIAVELTGISSQRRKNDQKKRFAGGLIAGIVLVLLATQTSQKPKLQISSSELEFAPVSVASPTASKQLTLQNIGGAVLHLGEIGISGDAAAEFDAKTDCSGAVLEPQKSCEIDVVLRPGAEGLRWADLTIPSDSEEQIARVRLAGTGVKIQTPEIVAEPAQLIFNQQVNTSVALPLVLHSTGGRAATIRSISADDQFYVPSQECVGTVLQPKSDCTMNVTFSPTDVNNGAATIAIEFAGEGDNEPARKLVVPVVAQVTAVEAPPPPAPGVLDASPSEVTFTYFPSDKITPAPVTIRNSGNGYLGLAHINITSGSDQFQLNNDCGALQGLDPQQSCTFTVEPKVREVGEWVGTLIVSSYDSVKQIRISATVQRAPFAAASVSPETIYAFNSGPVAAKKASKGGRDIVMVQSTGTTPLAITGIRFESRFFAMSENQTGNICRAGMALDPGQRCWFRVSYLGTAPQTFSRIVIDDNATNAPQSITVVGTAPTVAPRGTLEILGSGEFGTVSVNQAVLYARKFGTAPPGNSIVLRNGGNGDLTIKRIGLVGDTSSFRQIKQCAVPLTLASGATCELAFAFVPVRADDLAATLQVESDGSNPIETFPLHGVGASPTPPAPPTNLNVAVKAGSQLVSKQTAATGKPKMRRVPVQEITQPTPVIQ